MSAFDRKPAQDNIGGDCIEEIRTAIISEGLRASGKTQRSLTFTDTGDTLRVFTDGTGAPPKTLQRGREGGKVPKGFVGIIKQWIIDKGLTVQQVPYKTNRAHKYSVEERSLNMASGAIANKIAKEGTERYKQPIDNIYTPALERATERFKQRWLKELKEITINTLLK
jgi:hypothetical protein